MVAFRGRLPRLPAAGQLVIYGTLARALERESIIAVAHWWGVTPQTVTKWRRRLGIEGTTDGTQRLKEAHGQEPFFKRARQKALSKSHDPVRRQKIAASKIGKPRPKHVIEAVRTAHLGTVANDETRRKMSAAHKRRGTRPPKTGRAWTPVEDALLSKLSMAEVAKKSGRTFAAVGMRRRKLGLPDGRNQRQRINSQ